MRIFCTPRSPFTDRFVTDAYFELPLSSLIGQGVHGLAAMHEVPALGEVATGSFWLPLKYEVAFRHWMAGAKQLRGWLNTLAHSLVRKGSASPPVWWSGQQRRFEAARESMLFDRNAMDSLHGDPALARAASKLAATAIHVAHMVSESLPGTVRTHR
jgi:hypothetical protein